MSFQRLWKEFITLKINSAHLASYPMRT